MTGGNYVRGPLCILLSRPHWTARHGFLYWHLPALFTCPCELACCAIA